MHAKIPDKRVASTYIRHIFMDENRFDQAGVVRIAYATVDFIFVSGTTKIRFRFVLDDNNTINNNANELPKFPYCR